MMFFIAMIDKKIMITTCLWVQALKWKQSWASVENLLTLKIMTIIMTLAMLIYHYISSMISRMMIAPVIRNSWPQG